MRAFGVGTLGGVCAERVQCGGLARVYARGTLCREGTSPNAGVDGGC